MKTGPSILLAAIALLVFPVVGCTDSPVSNTESDLVRAEGSGLAEVVTKRSGGGGIVLPAMAKPLGYSLVEMASALANFSSSDNAPAYFPETPFQILYLEPGTETNTFTVEPGTKFFVPLLYINDSPPVIGDFPEDASTARDYVFGDEQFGAEGFAIIVDGRFHPIGPEYVAGPVLTPGLPGGGSHFIQIGAFLTPLPKGEHTLTIRGTLAGAVILELFGGPFYFEITYTVIVE